MKDSNRTIRLGIVQLDCESSPKNNIDRTIEQIESVADDGAQIICLQELFASQYFCQSVNHDYFELAESIPGPLTDRLAGLARELDVVIVSSHFERRAPGVFHNTAVTTNSDGKLAGIYRKMHIPDDPNFEEKFYFTPGDLGFQAVPTQHGKLGVCVLLGSMVPRSSEADRNGGR